MNIPDLMNLCLLLRRKYEALCKPFLREYGLRQSDLDVMMYLALNPDCRTAREISGNLPLAKSLVSASVDALTRRGLLSGETDTADRRRVLLTLLPPAWEIVRRIEQIAEGYSARITSGLTDEEMRVAERVAGRMRKNAQAGGR